MMTRLPFIIGILILSLSAACGTDSIPAESDDFTMPDECTAVNPYLNHFDSMPPGGIKLRTRRIGTLARVFNDSNYAHLESAMQLGIAPVTDARTAWNLRRPVTKITSCKEYFVDSLTHSLPFLVPKAARLLKEIGQRFNDTLAARGGGSYRIKVTSVLRTPKSIAKLRRRNRNAVDTSAHQFGTTFDISYIKFICDTVDIPRTQEDLKNLLAEVLDDFRNEGRCLVKYERKQGCFHITTQ